MNQRTQIARAFTALSHPRRVALFEIMCAAKNPLTYGALQSRSRLTAQPLTHHLKQMEASGLVVRRKKGRETLFTLAPTRLRSAIRLVDQTVTVQQPKRKRLSA